MIYNKFNTDENREILSKKLGLKILDIQFVDTKKSKVIVYFWPNFWWFQKRNRMSLFNFLEIINEKENFDIHFMVGKKCWLDYSEPLQICDVSNDKYKVCEISLFYKGHPSYKEENPRWVKKSRVTTW